jgi:hypothetical protein
MKRSLTACGIALLASLIIGIISIALAHNTLSIPDGWKSIGSQQTAADVERLIPGIDTSLRDVKADFAHHECVLGQWILQVTYDSRRHVQTKSMRFKLGTRKHFKAYHF